MLGSAETLQEDGALKPRIFKTSVNLKRFGRVCVCEGTSVDLEDEGFGGERCQAMPLISVSTQSSTE